MNKFFDDYFKINKHEKLYNPLCDGTLESATFTHLPPIYYV